jgi:cytochrome c-type biogenesis protein CcmF
MPILASLNRLAALPRGAWGVSLAHAGLGVFIMGAAFQSGWKLEADRVLAPGRGVDLGAYHLQLQKVADRPGPNYDAELAQITVRDRAGRLACLATPERRTYDVGGETTSKVALCPHGLDDIYVVVGERRAAPAGSVWLVRSYLNPWIRLVFLGPLLMALGGLISLSDRRMRMAAVRRPAIAGARLAPAE